MRSSFYFRLTGFALLAVASSKLYAVLPPPSPDDVAAEEARISALREEAPEFLTLKITHVSERDKGNWTQLSAEAEVVEVHRSELGHETGDTVHLLYCARWKAVEKFWEDLKRKAADGHAGPGVEIMPAEPMHIGPDDLISAWLKPVEDQGSTLVPAAGVYSFQRTSQSLQISWSVAGETDPVCR